MQIIAGKFRGRKLEAPKGSATRPTASRLRETVFDMLQNNIEEAEFLDIFAGSGAMGLEALSRGAKHAVFIESSRNALRSLQTNISQLQIANQTEVLAGDFLAMLEKLHRLRQQFGIVFADAPYHMTHRGRPVSEVLLTWFSQHDLIRKEGCLLIENDQEVPPSVPHPALIWINSRRSGKAFLHYFRKQ
jgi:16S rRNA (guanine966-N2)-methyltransferase